MKSTLPLESSIGMTLKFTQANSGDIVRIGEAQYFINQKCPSGHYVRVIPVGKSDKSSVMSEFEFNQAKPVLVKEGMEIEKRK